MVYAPNYTLIQGMFTGMKIIGNSWVLPIILTVLGMVFITRDIEKWKILAFPFLVLEAIMGIKVNAILIIISAIMFTIEVLSTGVLGNVLIPKRKMRNIIRSGIDRDFRNERNRAKMIRLFKIAKSRKDFGDTGEDLGIDYRKSKVGFIKNLFGKNSDEYKLKKYLEDNR